MSGPWERYSGTPARGYAAPWERYGGRSGDQVSALEAAGLGAADSALFGFSDELYGAGVGGLSALRGGDFSSAYDRATGAARRRRALAEDQQGGAFMAGQLGGALVGGGGLSLAGRAALRGSTALARIAQGTNWAGRIGLSAATSGAGGALYGAGSGDAGNRLQTAATYAGLGAVGGAAFSGLSSLVGPHLASAWRGMSPNRGAAEIMGQVLAREGLTDEQLAARLAEHAGQARGGMVLDALGPSGAHAAMGAAARPSAGRRVLTEAMDARQRAVGPRAQDEIWQELVGSAPEDVAQFITRMERVQRSEAAPLYAQAWREIGRVNPDRLRATVGETVRRHPEIFEPALARARRMSLAETGREIGDPSDPRFWHFYLQGAERELGARLRAASMGDLRGFAGSEAAIYSRAVANFNRQVRAALGPTFRRAQDTYAGAASAQDAAELGYSAISGNLNTLQLGALTQRFSRMSQGEQQAFRAAAANKLQDMVANATREGANRADILRGLIGTEGKRTMLTRIFGERGLNTLLRRFDYDRELLQNSINTGINVNSITSKAQAALASQQAITGAPTSPVGILNNLLAPQMQRAAERQGEAVSDRVLTLMAMPADEAAARLARPSASRRGLLSRVRRQNLSARDRLFYDALARRDDLTGFRQNAFAESLLGSSGLYGGVLVQPPASNGWRG